MSYTNSWENFLTAARGGTPETIPVALNADCRYIARALDMSLLDFLFYPARWLDAYLTLSARFPDVVFLPGFWVEFGIATEASAFGIPILWRHDQPPVIRPLNLPADDWHVLPQPDPYTDGLMAIALHRLWNLEHNDELPEPHRIRLGAARGPFAIASNLLGATRFLDTVKDEPDSTRQVLDLLDILTETTIRYLQAQLGSLRAPAGIILMDDTVGWLSASQFERFAMPHLTRILDTFDGLVRIFDVNIPCMHLLSHIARLPFEVFHFHHQMDIRPVKAALEPKAIMGNLSPLNVMVQGTPSDVEHTALSTLNQVANRGGLILSVGGTLYPDTPPDNIDALVEATLV